MNREKQRAIAAGFKVSDMGGEIRLTVAGLAYIFDTWQEVDEFLTRQAMLVAKNQGKAKRAASAKKRKNPAPRSALDAARRLAARFHGRQPEDGELYETDKPVLPDAMANIGAIYAIEYLAERDGTVYRFRHVFKQKSRPQLAVSPDGQIASMIGGSWTFTEDGFEDS